MFKAASKVTRPAHSVRLKSTKPAPGRSKVPLPNPPRRMVEEVATTPRGLRGFLRNLFHKNGGNVTPTFSDRQKTPLTLSDPNKPKFLHTEKTTNLLYWYCTDLTFGKSDFERVGPPNVTFKVTRARNPVNLTRWMGYFLEFSTKEDALLYFEETIGHELCGFPLKLRFTPREIQGYESPLLSKVPAGLPRRCHALILGLPVGFPEQRVLRVLWDYDLIDDDRLAVERLPMGNVKYGGNPMLLRFKNEKEADRFVRDHDREVFPYSENKVYCEVID